MILYKNKINNKRDECEFCVLRGTGAIPGTWGHTRKEFTNVVCFSSCTQTLPRCRHGTPLPISFRPSSWGHHRAQSSGDYVGCYWQKPQASNKESRKNQAYIKEAILETIFVVLSKPSTRKGVIVK